MKNLENLIMKSNYFKLIVILIHTYVLIHVNMTEQSLFIACSLVLFVTIYKYLYLKEVFNICKNMNEFKDLSDKVKNNFYGYWLSKITATTSSAILILTLIKSSSTLNELTGNYFTPNNYLIYYVLFNFVLVVTLIVFSGKEYINMKKGILK